MRRKYVLLIFLILLLYFFFGGGIKCGGVLQRTLKNYIEKKKLRTNQHNFEKKN